MTRVSENASVSSIQHSMGSVKNRLDQLQRQTATLKRIARPSDDPLGNVEVLATSSQKSDNDQMLKNSDFALMNLQLVESSLQQVTELMVRAKELAITQSSDLYGAHIREGVAEEVRQIGQQMLGIANRRVGNRYLFAGMATLTRPFNVEGRYLGDDGNIKIEISRDVFIPINLSGLEVFFSSDKIKETKGSIKDDALPLPPADRSLASTKSSDEIKPMNSEADYQKFKKRASIFGQISSLVAALETNDTSTIQNLLEEIDFSVENLITLRTKIGGYTNTVSDAKQNLEDENIVLQDRSSRIADADIAELFTDISKQQQILKATYKSGQNLLNLSLLDFMR